MPIEKIQVVVEIVVLCIVAVAQIALVALAIRRGILDVEARRAFEVCLGSAIGRALQTCPRCGAEMPRLDQAASRVNA